MPLSCRKPAPAWTTPTVTSSPIVYARNLGVDEVEADQRLATYLSLARPNGISEHGLSALMVLLAAYVGQPYTSQAMETVRRTNESS